MSDRPRWSKVYVSSCHCCRHLHIRIRKTTQEIISVVQHLRRYGGLALNLGLLWIVITCIKYNFLMLIQNSFKMKE